MCSVTKNFSCVSSSVLSFFYVLFTLFSTGKQKIIHFSKRNNNGIKLKGFVKDLVVVGIVRFSVFAPLYAWCSHKLAKQR